MSSRPGPFLFAASSGSAGADRLSKLRRSRLPFGSTLAKVPQWVFQELLHSSFLLSWAESSGKQGHNNADQFPTEGEFKLANENGPHQVCMRSYREFMKTVCQRLWK